MKKNLFFILFGLGMIFSGPGCTTFMPGIEEILGLNREIFVLQELDSEQKVSTSTVEPVKRDFFLNIVRTDSDGGSSVESIFIDIGNSIKGLKPGLTGDIYNGEEWIGECKLVRVYDTKGEAQVISCTNKIDPKIGKVKFTLTM